jgi:hypothetical protein
LLDHISILWPKAYGFALKLERALGLARAVRRIGKSV